MKYPIAIEWGDDNTATGIVFPDIPGAISAGDTLEEAYDNAVEAANIVLEDMAERGEMLPTPPPKKTSKKIGENPDFSD